MSKLILILPLMGILMYLLYINGYLVANSKRAAMFIGSRRGKKSRFSSCTGYIKRVIRFKENRKYHFALSTELSTGEISMELLDRAGQSVLSLDSNVREGSITAETKKRYELIIRFRSASGSYELDWM